MTQIRGFMGYSNLGRPAYELKPGEVSVSLRGGSILVAHPERAPKVVHSDGTETIVTPTLVEPTQRN